ncbi:protein LEKR1 isoform X3 [Scophthalmus maximus]|uniref:protein LEKR1 isoform X3 n=1 Tax=Scophthalmus maximus TaxID=52904 RepID=UPI001FA8C9B0|nr:protein LEKR1 isoform X3 [Scophthalmus maximus]
MGDEDRSMEAEREKETMTVHRCPPIHPLPEEIKKMERSETVCRYCGVSYLIYHEFHQLNNRLAQLEKELQEVRESAEREKAQREALELGRLEWERALDLEVRRKAEETERSVREELEEKSRDTGRLLREEFEAKHERKRREMEGNYQKISGEKEKQLRRELGDLEVERLRRQREELERTSVERENGLSDALQKANQNSDMLGKYLRQLEERLEAAASRKDEAERLLRKEREQREILRSVDISTKETEGVYVQQGKALRATISILHTSGSELTDVKGFLNQLMGAWQAFKSQILQHSTQAFSVLKEKLKHSCEDLQKMRDEREKLTQQLMKCPCSTYCLLSCINRGFEVQSRSWDLGEKICPRGPFPSLIPKNCRYKYTHTKNHGYNVYSLAIALTIHINKGFSNLSFSYDNRSAHHHMTPIGWIAMRLLTDIQGFQRIQSLNQSEKSPLFKNWKVNQSTPQEPISTSVWKGRLKASFLFTEVLTPCTEYMHVFLSVVSSLFTIYTRTKWLKLKSCFQTCHISRMMNTIGNCASQTCSHQQEGHFTRGQHLRTFAIWQPAPPEFQGHVQTSVPESSNGLVLLSIELQMDKLFYIRTYLDIGLQCSGNFFHVPL